MKRITAIMFAAILLVGLFPAGTVLAGQPNGHHLPFLAQGYFEEVYSVPSFHPPEGDVLVIDWVQETVMHSTFEGVCETNFNMRVNLTTLMFVSEGDTEFAGRVRGLPGDSLAHFSVSGHFTAGFPQNVALVFTGLATIVSGKGALSHLRGFYNLDAGIDQPANWFNYSGSAWYEP
jgi:hypothetical protein